MAAATGVPLVAATAGKWALGDKCPSLCQWLRRRRNWCLPVGRLNLLSRANSFPVLHHPPLSLDHPSGGPKTSARRCCCCHRLQMAADERSYTCIAEYIAFDPFMCIVYAWFSENIYKKHLPHIKNLLKKSSAILVQALACQPYANCAMCKSANKHAMRSGRPVLGGFFPHRKEVKCTIWLKSDSA